MGLERHDGPSFLFSHRRQCVGGITSLPAAGSVRPVGNTQKSANSNRVYAGSMIVFLSSQMAFKCFKCFKSTRMYFKCFWKNRRSLLDY